MTGAPARGGAHGRFDLGAARIESVDGEVLESRADPRSEFFGLSGLRRNLRWDALDSVYFAGYTMGSYLTTPLLLTRAGVEVAGRYREPATSTTASISTGTSKGS